MGEVKLFESGGYVVTTERVVYGTKVVRLDDINGGALPFIDRGYLGTAVIAGIGLLMVVFGGAFVKVVGLAVVVGAYFFFTSTISRSTVMSLKSGEGHRDQGADDSTYPRFRQRDQRWDSRSQGRARYGPARRIDKSPKRNAVSGNSSSNAQSRGEAGGKRPP
jgi:hypothetical protein